MKPLKLLLLAVLVLPFANCANVSPIQRAYLSKPVMLTDRDPLAKAMTDHMYFSREAAYGGEGVGGGGCGCN